MKIAIIGYGKMGRCIEQQAKMLNIEVSKTLDSTEELLAANFTEDEVAIDFTAPEFFKKNIQILLDKKVNVVVGTTGWDDKRAMVKEMVKERNLGLLWSSNFSIGVNLFLQMAGQATKIFDKFKNYDVFLHEAHHRMKKDAPSGTAIGLADEVLANSSQKKQLSMDVDREVKKDDLIVSVTRGGDIPGIHSVFFDSSEDTIELTHTARNRDGFALGAVKSAQWLHGKKGFFTMQDFLKDLN